jgi:hypothetical protein
MNEGTLAGGRGVADHPAGVWLGEPAREMTVLAGQCDFSLSLLMLDDAGPRWTDVPAPEMDVYERIVGRVERPVEES